MSTSNAGGTAAAPVPVSAARAERDAILSASTAGAARRKNNGSDPLQQARHIGAALNVGVMDYGFYWVTGVTTDGTIIVANSYGLAYIPDGVNLPEQVRMATADESIPATERARWATYPILAVQGWAHHHNHQLRAVVATEEQFSNFDPGVAKIVLTQDDIPETGQMQGRSRLEVIAPDAAQRLGAVSDFGLNDLLPPASADIEAPADDTARLWFEVAKPLMSTNPQRSVPHLKAFVAYAVHAQEIALYNAHISAEPADQRRAIADWVYWQHLQVLMSDAVGVDATV
ncbi:secretion protein EccK [Mycobacterium sp. 4D054]|uniref:secretion protein EccK n=2 Tax=Mycobacterium TaxID=1763 RepID=UPI0021B33EEE|nr:secretion protein EccK [Mycobacterium sp. SMC-8]UXA13722.1 secretion protein EccK [Mycobacterium sp. SMC-8]